jgi:ankyrin repeat protein
LENDLPLVKRILDANPTYLQNPDHSDKANTSLHLAAQKGYVEIAVCPCLPLLPSHTLIPQQEHLVSLGHDFSEPPGDFIYLYSTKSQGPSYNTDGHTPLHLAASHSHTAVVERLCSYFPHLVNKPANDGSTPLHLASRAHPTPSIVSSTFAARISTKAAEDTSTIETLIANNADIHAEDHKGNTCLHYASAWGNLKAVRVLVQSGADPLARNKDGWTPEYYSVTVQAEVYYRNLVAEWERRKAEDEMRMKESRARSAAGVRLVDNDDTESSELSWEDARDRADSGASRRTNESNSGLGLTMPSRETWK